MLINLDEIRAQKSKKKTKFILKYECKKISGHCGVTIYKSGKNVLIILTQLVNDISLESTILEAINEVHLIHFPRVPPNQLIFVQHDPHQSEQCRYRLVKFEWESKTRSLCNPKLIEVTSWLWTEMILFFGFYKEAVDANTFKSAIVLPFTRKPKLSSTNDNQRK